MIFDGVRCEECGAVIRDQLGGSAILIDFFTRRYPKDGSECRVVCNDCGAETTCYEIGLDRLVKEGLDDGTGRGWITHLRLKLWWCWSAEDGLTRAYERARRLPYKHSSTPSAPTRTARRRGGKTPEARLISTRTRTRVMERDGFRCRRCGARAPEAVLVIDHILAVALGGSADESNLQTLCVACNAGKADRPPHEHDLGAGAPH